MALQLGALRDALLEAGATVESARKASEEVASYENRLASIDTKLERLDGRLTLMQWMLALLIGGVGSLLLKAFA